IVIAYFKKRILSNCKGQNIKTGSKTFGLFFLAKEAINFRILREKENNSIYFPKKIICTN
ncbi:hypothetical protein V7212_13460, partial [Bacillus safensis]|uniref:hypothetical protein n=1 Tax=Bacillus safensis TaxID=561879 RepID=UPI002FFE2916